MQKLERIAFLSVHTSPLAPMGGKKTGGMNVYIRELAAELGSRGFEVDIFTRRSSVDEPEMDCSIHPNVRVIYLTAGAVTPLPPDDIYPLLSEFTARLMAFTTLRNLSYDIIYSHYWLSGWVAQKLKEAWGVPFVQMFHTLGQMKNRIVPGRPMMPDERISTELKIIEWADRIIAATPAEHAQLMWLYRARRRKIEVIPPGVNIARFQPLPKAKAKAQLGFDPDCNVLLFVGRIEPLKGIDTIVEALRYVAEHAPQLINQLCFAVVGGDPDDKNDAEFQRLIGLVKQNQLEDVVSFHGAKEQSQLPLYYAAATAVLMPSDYESFGMVALEAMASGTPVIATQTGGLAFLVRDEETGFLVPVREPESLASRIRDLLTEPERSAKMGQQASHLAQNYSWSKIADRLVTLFESIILDNASRSNRRRN